MKKITLNRKKILKAIAIYYLIGLVLLLWMGAAWSENGQFIIHPDSITHNLTSWEFWVTAWAWPIFITCYFPPNIICHA